MTVKPQKKTPLAAVETLAADTVAEAKATAPKLAAAPADYAADLAQLGSGNLEAVIAANQAFARGAETMSKQLFGFAQTNFQLASAAAQGFFSAKTFQDVVELNSKYAKASVDTFLANSAQLTELALQVANEAAQPLQARVDATISTLTKPLAA